MPRAAVLANWESGFAGVRTTDLERFTVVLTAPAEDPVSVYRTRKPCDQESVVKALAPDASPVKRNGKVFHVNAAGAAVYFADDRLFLSGPEKLVMQVVEKRGPDEKTRLASALRQAVEHDLFAWSRAAEPEECTRKPCCCYKYSPDADKASPLGALASCPGLPMPAGVEAADLSLDLGIETVVRLHLDFTDEESAHRGAKLARVGMDALRAGVLVGVAELSAIDSAPEFCSRIGPIPDLENVAAAATGLLPVARPLEKALMKAVVRADGTTVPVTVSVPVSAKKIRTALVAALTLAAHDSGTTLNLNSLVPFRAWKGGTTPPSQVPCCPQRGCLTVPGCGSAVEPIVSHCSPAGCGPMSPPTAPLSAFPAQQPETPGASPFMPASNGTPGPASGPTAVTTPTPPGMSSSTVLPTAMSPSAAVKLTVANVTPELALLFSEENGKLVFSRKVPAGEAVDVETTTGKRWVAVFVEHPASETYTVTGSTPWLLRPTNPDLMKALSPPATGMPVGIPFSR
jgi:hypothetical protein